MVLIYIGKVAAVAEGGLGSISMPAEAIFAAKK